jgi:23S rRNA pseudouridine1911/1915/1917 synthase
MTAGPAETTITVPDNAAGTRVDIFLAHTLHDLSRAQIQRLIAAGLVTVNGTPVQKRCPVAPGDRVWVSAVRDVPRENTIKGEDIPVVTLYEDDWLIAVDKPAGLVVHPGISNRSGTLVNALVYRGAALSNGSSSDRPGIVHRLDKETSGVMIVAKTNAAHAALARAFASRTIKKEYVGFCVGVPRMTEGTIDVALGRSRSNPVKRKPDAAGKASQTGYRVIGSRNGISLVRFRPQTGRTHQIRVHCSSRGFPIVADELYGGGPKRIQRLSPLFRPFALSIFECFSRHALHARSINFLHPMLEKELKVEAPFPEDFRKALEIFGPEAFETA